VVTLKPGANHALTKARPMRLHRPCQSPGQSALEGLVIPAMLHRPGWGINADSAPRPRHAGHLVLQDGHHMEDTCWLVRGPFMLSRRYRS
jgi:hypothetical protein